MIIKYINYTFLLFLVFSCKEKQSDSFPNIPKTVDKSINDISVDKNYSQISIDCDGEQFAPSNCGNKKTLSRFYS